MSQLKMRGRQSVDQDEVVLVPEATEGGDHPGAGGSRGEADEERRNAEEISTDKKLTKCSTSN